MRKTVLDVIEGGVDEHARVIPCTRLDADSFVDERVMREILVRDGDRCKTVLALYLPRSGEYSLCLLRSATREPSALHTTYLTGGVVISASVFCCWMSYRTTDDVELRIRLAVPP